MRTRAWPSVATPGRPARPIRFANSLAAIRLPRRLIPGTRIVSNGRLTPSVNVEVASTIRMILRSTSSTIRRGRRPGIRPWWTTMPFVRSWCSRESEPNRSSQAARAETYVCPSTVSSDGGVKKVGKPASLHCSKRSTNQPEKLAMPWTTETRTDCARRPDSSAAASCIAAQSAYGARPFCGPS
jgi:hypothetical protein